MRTPVWIRLLPDRTILALATVAGLGRLRPGPGTWGSVAGIGLHAVAFHGFPWWSQVATLALLAVLAAWVCGEAEWRLRRPDPPEVVLDEFVAVPLCFLGLCWVDEPGPAWLWLVAGFLLFRFFDIAKPLGIARVQRLPGGWGVVADDLAAAGVTAVILTATALLWPGR